eukprot:TRINITY_DN26229_c0_g1_i1.p1 TRINITY_DN26229_c0_g1~~TRINITY_DN26229_c0_g1_i1.p1  ORF type:complete len:492 (-),score=138.85 TRINITY_DN26229_c0_g1_i1:1-1407(-)
MARGARLLAARRPLVLALTLALVAAFAADVAGSADAKPEPKAKPKRSRVRATCAPELGLVTEKETAKSYAKHALTLCNSSSPWAEQSFAKLPEVVAFVAPWNDHGYKAARYIRRRLSAVAPLWFRILPSPGGKKRGDADRSAFEIVGGDMARAEEQRRWKAHVTAGANVDLLPHFSIEGFERLEDLRALLEKPEELVAEIAVMCEKEQFGGIIFDLRLALFRSVKPLVPRLVRALGQALRGVQRRLMVSVPAPLPNARAAGSFDQEDAAAIAGDVDAVILGTRDFSRDAMGPLAPLPWMRASANRLLGKAGGAQGGVVGLRPDQLIIEIPMYGRAFPEQGGAASGGGGGKVILAAEIAKALAKQRPPLVWDDEAREHAANVTEAQGGGRIGLSLPTLKFVAERLQLASSLGAGVALRDLGAGFDVAFDLLPFRADSDDDFGDNDGEPAAAASAAGAAAAGGATRGAEL